nr:MAG TPA: TetR family Transcriptional regulator [Caudoviricetes sp.]
MIDITLAKDIPHRITITDAGIEYWTVTAITRHIGVAKATFASYVARGQAPQPAFQVLDRHSYHPAYRRR